MKSEYTEAEIKVIEFDTADVIATSKDELDRMNPFVDPGMEP